MMVSSRSLSLLIAPLIATGATFAAENPGSHQHGHAELQLAISGQQVELLLRSPAHNLLGFEHRARTPEQQQRVDSVALWLNETPLINTPAASCTLETADLQSGITGTIEDHQHGDHGQHADFEVIQVLNCPDLGNSDILSTPLIERFPGLEYLEIAWIGPSGQGAVRLAQDENRFSLAP
ncbi:ZrgA family zinc uptake protein [Marinobacter sp. F4206]|uniref:ZrgA family zinc uptake protein n=1 Tax=Marinobacter sp. F4206 TaxID=2861777 RepID=UPI001C606206|nr:DUF2796 domain-containing protein [Marinobacter sp. F4206]MBW4934550.1 DUF2796 domain-containing protein [Marinobacter sp. F4206]